MPLGHKIVMVGWMELKEIGGFPVPEVTTWLRTPRRPRRLPRTLPRRTDRAPSPYIDVSDHVKPSFEFSSAPRNAWALYLIDVRGAAAPI
jgi:hypothetical protein